MDTVTAPELIPEVGAFAHLSDDEMQFIEHLLIEHGRTFGDILWSGGEPYFWTDGEFGYARVYPLAEYLAQ